MPLNLQYNTSFTGGSPYELGRVEHGYAQEDEEEKLRRQLELEQEQGRQARYADSVKLMEAQRAQRLGYGTIEQKIADPYSDLYNWSPQPAAGGPAGMVNIGMQDPNGAMVETLRRPMMRTLAPDAMERISLFREATRKGSAMTPAEVAEREKIEADEAIRVAQERNRLLAGRQSQAAQQGVLRTSAQIQAGAHGADDLQIAKDYETSATAAMTANPARQIDFSMSPVPGAAAGANPTPIADEIKKPPPAATPEEQEARKQKDIQDTIAKYRKRGFSEQQIMASLKKNGLI